MSQIIKPVRPYRSDLMLTGSIITKKTLAIEIGCGAGLHPIAYAKKHPDHHLIALERTKEKFSAFMGRHQSHGLGNLTPINEDAETWLPKNVPPRSVQKYFLLYPNPYPKESQANKRWHRNPFFHFLLETLAPGGTIEMATNELFYFKEAKMYLSDFWKLPFEAREFQEVSWLDDPRPRTHFEKKYLARGETCYNLIVRKP